MVESHDPVAEFVDVFERVAAQGVEDATVCALATADGSGRPSVRMVLLKGVDERGFVFYTNYGSRKAEELEVNPRAALCFYWRSVSEQVRVEGSVERVSDEESDRYFASRPRASRIGAWASRQSRPLESRAELLRRFASFGTRFALGTVPRPEFWGGYRIAPERIEFWFSKGYRLHDRRLYRRQKDGWSMQRLYP